MLRIATAPNATSTLSPVAFDCHRLTPACSPLDGVSLNCSDAWRVESSVSSSSSAAIPFASISVPTVLAGIRYGEFNRADGTVLYEISAAALKQRECFVNFRPNNKP